MVWQGTWNNSLSIWKYKGSPISSAFAPYPLFQWYPQSKDIKSGYEMLKLSI
jgi:hypothetical protein